MKAEHQRIDAFELWCLRRLLRVSWTARRSNQSILEISPGCSLEGMMLKLKLQCWSWNSSTLATSCEELTYWKRLWCWEGLGAGGEGDNRGWDGWMASLTRWTWVWVNSESWWWTGRPGVLRFMQSQSQTLLSDWTELKPAFLIHLSKSLKLVYTSSINSDLVWSNYKQYYVILVKLHTYIGHAVLVHVQLFAMPWTV